MHAIVREGRTVQVRIPKSRSWLLAALWFGIQGLESPSRSNRLSAGGPLSTDRGRTIPLDTADFVRDVLLKAAWNRLFPQTVKPTERNICSAGLKSLCDNLCAKRFCSVGLQADTVDSSTCPPDGGRYIDQNQVLTKTPKPGHPRRPENCAYAAAKLRKSRLDGENNAATRD